MMQRMSELIDGWDADEEISVFRTVRCARAH
jgi:hypothetical protein